MSDRSAGGLRLLDRVRELIRIKHDSIRTQRAYLQWIRRYIRFHGRRHPPELGADTLRIFLSDLAVRRSVTASPDVQNRKYRCANGNTVAGSQVSSCPSART